MTQQIIKSLILGSTLSLMFTACFHDTENMDTPAESASITINADNVLSDSDGMAMTASTQMAATAEITLDDSMMLSGSVTVSNGTASKVEIRDGDAGVNGDLVVELNDDDNDGIWSVAQMVEHTHHMRYSAGGLYVSIHDDSGEILRGQILPHDVFSAQVHIMSDDGHGNAFITASESDKLLKAYVHTHDLSNITAVSIYISDSDEEAYALSENEDGVWVVSEALDEEHWELLENEELSIKIQTADSEIDATIKLGEMNHDDHDSGNHMNHH